MPRTTVSPPRRITRSSLARFTYNNKGDEGSKTSSPDIEDAIPDLNPPETSRKRKRTTVTKTQETADGSRDGSRVVKTTAKIKSEYFETVTETRSAAETPKRRQPRKPARKTTDPKTGEQTVSPPSDWEAIYDTVKAMRAPGGAAANAAVDTMGCERLADANASPRDQRFQTLVALMLSSQTKDTVNAVAMHRLKTELESHDPSSSSTSSSSSSPPGLTLQNILAAEPSRLNELIRAVGFHNNKTKYLQAAAAICRDQWGGDIPDTIEGLVALPGVGPKMAHLCLSAAWDRTEGIGVDVHVHRITNLWGWHDTKNPEATRAALESWLPRDRWREINTLLVGLGQTVCLPVGRRCGDCELGLKGLCRAAERKKVVAGRKAREEVETVVKIKGKDGEEEGRVLKVEERVVEERREGEVVVNGGDMVKDDQGDDMKVKIEGQVPR